MSSESEKMWSSSVPTDFLIFFTIRMSAVDHKREQAALKLQLHVSSTKLFFTQSLASSTSKVTTPQDAHGRLVLQVYLGSNTLKFSAIRR